ncbi:MAG: (2Fe-2S) ferredoxin domain-containing protein [Xenococcaceae cyanobacterium]
MAKSKSMISEFKIKGELVNAIIKKDSQVKYLKLVADNPEKTPYWIKVAKNIREDIVPIAYLGANIIVKGTKKPKIKKGIIEYKADYIELVNTNHNGSRSIAVSDAPTIAPEENRVKAKAKILICEKSNCWKKGGKQVYQALKDSCGDRQVQVKTVGCLKQCKKAPNIVIMPDKVRYSKVTPKQIPNLIEKHLLTHRDCVK